MGYDLSVIITARNEEFLSNTIEDVLENIRGKTEIIVILDGYWPIQPITQHEDLTILHYQNSIGQRAGINKGVNISEAKYIIKLDAHCSVSEGFDVQLMENCEYDWTVIPTMFNLHVFDWECQFCKKRIYQGPEIKECSECHSVIPQKKIIVWKEKRNPRSEHYRFDRDLKFKYWREFKKRPEAKGDIVDTMSCLGAAFFMHRKRYWELGGMDENHGSWGQMGTELACKSWLSGGRMVTNKKAWFSHMFRTGHGFGFPYTNPGSQIKKARKYSQDLWLNNKWPNQKYNFDWLIKKFHPIPDWEDYVPKETVSDLVKKTVIDNDTDLLVLAQGNNYVHQAPLVTIDVDSKSIKEPKTNMINRDSFLDFVATNKSTPINDKIPEKTFDQMPVDNSTLTPLPLPPITPSKRIISEDIKFNKKNNSNLTKGIVYYTNNKCEERIMKIVQNQIVRAANGKKIVSVSQYPINFGENIVIEIESSYLSMFKQITAGLLMIDTDIVFLAEHDIIYHPSHFDFTPPKKDRYYYNYNVWKVDYVTGEALYYDGMKQVSGLVGYRETLLNHYIARLKRIEKDGFKRSMGFEPGKKTPKGVDDIPYKSFRSKHPNVDIGNNGQNITRSRFKLSEYRCRDKIKDSFIVTDEVPFWGKSKGNINKFLRNIHIGF